MPGQHTTPEDIDAALDDAERAVRNARDQLLGVGPEWISLTAAAKVMRRSSAAVERLVLSHRLAAYLNDDGEWRISRKHAERLTGKGD